MRSRIRRPMLLCGVLLAACSAPTAPKPAPMPTRAGGVEMLSMTVPRAFHAAARLANGKVLICGGTSEENAANALVSAELYEPESGSFVPTGDMSVAREEATATLLRNGTVLIAGGTTGTALHTTLASAELYDPATGAFRPTGSMTTARQDHTATLLPDGRVLITGGTSDGVHALATAEIYDPATGSFASTGTMTVAREGHTATLMDDGHVLIAGGGHGDARGGYTVYASAEIFDPATGKFAAVLGHMVSARTGHVAVRLRDGRVLLAGGKTGNGRGESSAQKLFSLAPLDTAEVFDPRTGKFKAVGRMAKPHYLASATLLDDGTVLVAGGWRLKGPIVVGMRVAELFDPTTGTFSTVGPLQVGRLEGTATLLHNGQVLIAGGLDNQGGITATAELYDPATRNFIPRPFQRYQRRHNSAE